MDEGLTVGSGKAGPSAPQNIAIASTLGLDSGAQLPQTPVSPSANSGSFESVYSVRSSATRGCRLMLAG